MHAKHLVNLGFTLIEAMLALALLSIGMLAVADAIPTLVQNGNQMTISNNLQTLQSVKDNLRADISASGTGDIQTTSRFSLYMCQYPVGSNSTSTCTPLSDPGFGTQLQHQKECIASAASGQVANSNQSVVRITMYRGIGDNLEYFYSEIPWDQTENLEKTLADVCTTAFNASPSGIANPNWIQMNNPNVDRLQAFTACDVDNSDVSTFISHSPPNACTPPANQIGDQSEVKCEQGTTGANSIVLYYSFGLNGSASSSQQENSFSDAFIIPLTNRPCINDASTNL